MNYWYCECGCGRYASITYSDPQRGNRHNIMCEKCYRDLLRPHVGEILKSQVGKSNKLKDVTTTYNFPVVNMTPRGAAYLMHKEFASSRSRRHSPVYNNLKSTAKVVPFIADTLIADGDIILGNGKFKVTFTSKLAGLERDYETNRPAHEWMDFIRESEDDFCELIGVPYWSALKTGTRKVRG